MPFSARRLLTRPGILSAALLLAFVIFGTVHFAQDFDDTGSDLGASYLGCRLFTTQDAVGHLYSHDLTDFASVTHDAPWQSAADDGDYTGWLHPYVQTPLWAWSLQPLCRRLQFPGFDRVFTALALLCFAGLIALVARFWAPRLRSPLATLLVLLALWFSTPFQYAMYLTQTHILYLVLTVAALLLAERRHALVAGSLLALAAAVKLTPAVFLLYWLITRRYRAGVAFVVASFALLAGARLCGGHALFADYLATLHRVSQTLLVTENNQSLAATLMAHRLPAEELHRVRTFALPGGLSLASDGLLLGSTLLGGLLDRAPRRSGAAFTPPFGALFVLVASTLFSPLAWTHYFIVLLAPGMVFAEFAVSTPRSVEGRLALLSGIAVLALNLPPLAPDVTDLNATAVLVHPQFIAGLLCLVSLLLLALRRRYRVGDPQSPSRLPA